jgi:hypothetical protein
VSRLVWDAVESLAARWKTSPPVVRYAAPLTELTSPLGRAMAELTTSTAYGQPLLHAQFVQASDSFAQIMTVAGAQAWLTDGTTVARQFLVTVEWLRARLPGYPLLAAPQLVRNSPWTSGELPLRIPWLAQWRRQGLQFRPAPPGVGDGLRLPHQAHDNDARRLGAAIAAADASVYLEQTLAALTSADEGSLTEARAELRRRLASDQLDATAGADPLKRYAYGEALMHQVIQQLPPRPREFALATEAADRLVTQATALFSQHVIYGPPRILQGVRRVERTSGGDNWTEAVVDDPPGPPIRLLEVVRFNTPGVDEAMLVEACAVRFPTPEESGEATVSGRLLPDSDCPAEVTGGEHTR